MNIRLLSLLAFAFFTFSVTAQRYQEMIDAGNYQITEIQKEAEAYFDIVGHGRGTGYKQFKRWEYVALMELDENGVKIPNNELSQLAREYRQTEQARLKGTGFSSGNWQQLGPTYKNGTSGWNPGVGRITSLSWENGNNLHMIIGSPTGGVWKTIDGGATWMPLTDEFSTVDVYALEISPYNSQHYLWGSTSGKIFQSIDGGQSWTASQKLTGSGKVIRILFHPTDASIVYAVSESNGLFRSTDGGSTWTGVNDVNGVKGQDVEFKPGDPSTIYFTGTDVFKSTDDGNSFTQISGFETANNNYKMIGVSPANPAYVYVVESSGGKFGAFYKSTNSGDSFNKLQDGADINYFGYSDIGDDDKGQAPRDMDVAVSLSDEEEVHIAGVHTWKSIDGGVTFFLTSYWTPSGAISRGVGYNHADIDLLKFSGDTLFVTSDGGIYRSTDGAFSFTDLSGGLCVKEFYKIGVSKTDPNVVSGGSQDNGTSVMRGADRQWFDWLGADGMESFVDWNNANNLYGTSQYGSMYRSTNQGNSRSGISKPPDVEDGAWVTPFEQDPQVPNTIYAAFADVWKTSNYGATWEKISDYDNGNFNQMKLAPTDNQRIYVSRSSNLYTTPDGGTTWVTTNKGWGSSSISYIAVHPLDPMHLLIVTSSSVYESIDAGDTWTNIGPGLPSGTKYCAAWENTGKNGIYVGGFGFVAYTNDDLPGQWVGYFDGLPNARVYELEINYISNTIFAGTYGRGLWESPIYNQLPPVSAFGADQVYGCVGATIAFNDLSVNTPNSWEWEFQGGTPATSTEQNPVVTYDNPGIFPVQLKVTNNAGEDTYISSDYITIFGPHEPMVTDVERCDSGQVTLHADPIPGETTNWYSESSGGSLLATGPDFSTDIDQTTTFYASSISGFQNIEHVGPVSNAIGGGGIHAGNFFLIFDVHKPITLNSVTVYADADGDRVFQLLDVNDNVLFEKTIFVPVGESRIDLDFALPQANDLKIGCPSPADLFRNNEGVNYPYSVGGLVDIKSSTAGADYYYYLYDWEIEESLWCESDRIPVSAIVNTAPAAPVVTPDNSATICPGESLELSVQNICPSCTLTWSTGETSQSIEVQTAGTFFATLNNQCGSSSASNEVEVQLLEIPEAPVITAVDPLEICLGESVELSIQNPCSGCDIIWSTDQQGTSINVNVAGAYTATQSNICGESPVSAPIEITVNTIPDATVISASGNTELCSGESVDLSIASLCDNCTVLWSTGETSTSITVATAGAYTASIVNECGTSPASNEIKVEVSTLPSPPTIFFVGPSIVCPGSTSVLALSHDCPGCSVLWSNGDSLLTIFVEAGVYTAIVSNQCGDSPQSNSLEVEQGYIPDAPVISTSDMTDICLGEIVELTVDSVCANCDVMWSNGELGVSINTGAAGIYSASIGNICGFGAPSNEIEVTVTTIPDAPVISSADATTFCLGDSAILTIENICPSCDIMWSSGQSIPEITVSSTGIYTAIHSNQCGESVASNEIEVIVQTAPDAPVISASGATDLCFGESVTLTVENICDGCSVSWSNGQTSSSLEAMTEGTYTAVITNACGESSASNELTITIAPAFVPMITLTNICQLTGPSGGSNYQWYFNGVPIAGANTQSWMAQDSGMYTLSMNNGMGCNGLSAPITAKACVSGTQDLSTPLSVAVFPNPSSGRIFVQIQSVANTSVQMKLYDIDGKFIGTVLDSEMNAGKQSFEVNLPKLPAGAYKYSITTTAGVENGDLILQPR